MSCRPLALFFLAATALLSACGDGKDGNNEQAVAMRDMEVVDGTATDAMTDLDGVQTEGIALTPAPGADRKSVVWGKSVSVRVDLGGRRIIKKKKQNKQIN